MVFNPWGRNGLICVEATLKKNYDDLTPMLTK